ncbi:unnamed protein product [Brassica rapa subsp. narinosa]
MCLWEPKLLLRVGNRAAGACVASSPDSDLEAFSHNPAQVGFPLSVPVLSWLFDARGKIPKEPFPVRPPADTRRSTIATSAAQAARQQSTGTELGPSSPALIANPFPKVTDPFCRLPCLHCSIDHSLFTLET